MTNKMKELLQMAKEWQCDDNQVVLTLIDQYVKQIELIDKCYAELSEPDCVFCNSREDRYKGEMLFINPLITNMPKLVDASNKTASLIVKTIMNVGIRPEAKEESAFEKFLAGEDDGSEEE